MNNDINGIFELPLKDQSEMQSCNESESKPNIALKRIGQELDKAETKCFTLKSELNYMMDVCRKAQTEIRESKEHFDISPIISPFHNSPDSKSPIEHNGCNSEIADTFNLSPKFAGFSSRKRVDDDNVIERFESLIEKRQKELLNATIVPRTQLDKELPHSIMPASGQGEITEADRKYKSYYFPSSMSLEQLTAQADEDYLGVAPRSASGEDAEGAEDLELNLDAPNTAKRRVVKGRLKTERSEINSVIKADNAVFKARKRKAKLLRSSVSKSTVTTRDTGFIGRKEAKRRRHRGGHGVVSQQSNPPKQLKKSNDVVEIFHNDRLKNKNSGSSKHAKVEAAKYERKPNLPETVERRNPEVPSPKDRAAERNDKGQSYDMKNKRVDDNCPQTQNTQNSSRATPKVSQEQDKLEKHSGNLDGPGAQNETRQYVCALNRPDDPMFTPSYEMPTLASKLKRSGRSYFSRFNFRNIPFVVGTSVTPSHNLGLNIQQVLSVMKTRQPIASDVTPQSLIRKVSRGMRPMSLLLDQMNGHYEGSVLDLSSQMIGTFNSPDRDKRLSVFNLHHVGKTQSCVPGASADAETISEKVTNVPRQLCKGKGDSWYRSRTKQQYPFAVSESNVPAQNHRGISRMSLKGNIDDHRTRIPDSHNSKEIRDVLINLHDQFEEMHTKYERLQSEVNKTSDDKSKELSVLEKELNAKEEEINAVVGLYKEVMTLKRQMKTLHEKNSLVYIATDSAKELCKDTFPLPIIPGRSSSMNPTQVFGRRKIDNVTREPPASMQLAALLRQIQTFHKQLQLVS